MTLLTTYANMFESIVKCSVCRYFGPFLHFITVARVSFAITVMTQCPASPMTPNVIDSTESECEQCPPPPKKQKKDTPSLPKGMASWIMDLTTDDGEGKAKRY